MTEQEAAALVAFANQNDGRVQANKSTYEVWHYALSRYPYPVARAVMVKHYATTEPVRGQQPPPLDPMTVKRGIGRELERMEAQRSALEATRQHHELTAAQPTPDAPPTRATGGPSKYQLALQQAQAATRMPD